MREKITLDECQIKDIERLASRGLSIKEISECMGFSKATLDRRISESEDVKAAIEKGRSKGIFEVSNTAFEMATSGKHASMTMFWLKTRAGWSEEKDKSNSEIIINVSAHELEL